MKKSILKSITVFTLLGAVLGVMVLNSCQKNVGDVYEHKDIVFAPDFEIKNVDYDIDNDQLNTESTLTFKVDYKNNEVTETAYSSVLNFYVDGILQESVMLKNIESGRNYEHIFEWKALLGEHEFSFEINLTSEGEKFIKEANVANNTFVINENVALKELVVETEEVIAADEAIEAIKADSTNAVAETLAGEGLVMSTTEEAQKTTYDNGATVVVIPVEDAATGEIDSTVTASAATVPEVASGNQEEATVSVVATYDEENEEVTLQTDVGTVLFSDGSFSLVTSKSARAFAPCTEPGNFELFLASPDAINSFLVKYNAAVATLGEVSAQNLCVILLETMIEYGFTQGGVDNDPVFTAEILNHTDPCSVECINGQLVNRMPYPGFILHFSDDRNSGVVLAGTDNVISSFSKAANCESSNNGTYIFEDCGGNSVAYIFSEEPAIVKTGADCVPNVHN